MPLKSLLKGLCFNIWFCLPFQNMQISVVGLLGAENGTWNCPEICILHNSNIRCKSHENAISIPCVTSITVYDGLHDFWLTTNVIVNIGVEWTRSAFRQISIVCCCFAFFSCLSTSIKLGIFKCVCKFCFVWHSIIRWLLGRLCFHIAISTATCWLCWTANSIPKLSLKMPS